MSDLVEAASESMGIPTALVERSAAARAAEAGNSMDEILSAWAGGEAAPAPAEAPDAGEAADTAEPETTEEGDEEAAEPTPEPAPTTVVEAPEPPPPPAAPEPEPAEPLEPVALSTRVRTAVRVGSWTGAGLGIVSFLMATAVWAPSTAVLPDTGPVVQVDPNGVLIGVALISVVFGAVVASLSRAAAAWSNPAMELSNSRSSTAWFGALMGLALGAVAGAVLSRGLATPVEGSEAGLVQLPVLATLGVMLVGGALAGALTAALPQLLGTPVALSDPEEEIEVVKARLGNAMSIPMAAAVLLILLVLPFGYLLVQSNHLGANGAAIVATLTAGGILGFASLAGTKPGMKVSFGEVMVAVAGIGTVLLIILAVLAAAGDDDAHHEDAEGEATPVVFAL